MFIGSIIAGIIDDSSDTIAIYVFFWPIMLAMMLVFAILAWTITIIKKLIKKGK